MKVIIIGAGVMGLTLAAELNARGASVEIYEQGSQIGGQSCSWFAGGMLAPWCEKENADAAVLHYGRMAAKWWRKHLQDTETGVVSKGTLIVAQARDKQELSRFSRRTEHFNWLDNESIAAIEPDLADRFQQALYFPDEGHLDPRRALHSLSNKLQSQGVKIHFNQNVDPEDFSGDAIVDCRGFKSKKDWSELRGVKGEMIIVKTEEVSFQRPIRLLHPRIPLYVVPRSDHHFMIGATMLENAQRERFSVRSMLELLGSAYALHPSFAEAEIVETGVDVRPAFTDNLPKIERKKNIWRINGLYRHGFLLSPSMAEKAARSILEDNYQLEQMNEYCA